MFTPHDRLVTGRMFAMSIVLAVALFAWNLVTSMLGLWVIV